MNVVENKQDTRTSPVQHDRKAHLRNKKAVASSVVNPGSLGAQPKPKLISERERKLLREEEKKRLSSLEEYENKKREEEQEENKDKIKIIDRRRFADIESIPTEPTKNSISSSIEERTGADFPERFVTVESLALSRGELTPNAVWDNGTGSMPVRVVGLYDGDSDNPEYARVAGSHSAVRLNELTPIEEKTQPVQLSPEELEAESSTAHLPPPPEQNFFDNSDQLSTEIPEKRFSDIAGNVQQPKPIRRHPRPGFWGYAPRIAAGFSGGLAAMIGTSAIYGLAGATAIANPVMTMAFAGGALTSEYYRHKNKQELSPQWKEIKNELGWSKRQCIRWGKQGFSPQEAYEWNDVFRQRENASSRIYKKGGTSQEPKLAAAFRNSFEGASPKESAPYINAWMTPKDVNTWVENTGGDPATMETAVLTHRREALKNGGVRVPADKIFREKTAVT